MSTSWMAPLGGLPGLGAVVLVGLVAVVGLICYCRAGPAPELPPRRDLLESCANQLAGAAGPAEARAVVDALQALGEADPEARQAVLDVICGYLRRPSGPPGVTAQVGTAAPAAHAAARALLRARLVPRQGGAAPWSDLQLDLSGASVQDLDLRGAVLRSATFTGTRFSGVTRLTGVRCAGRVVFTDAVFTGPLLVDDVDFTGPVRFTGARFDTTVSFIRTTFRGRADFAGAFFTGPAEFGSASFLGDAVFAGGRGPAVFLTRARFERTCFTTVTFAGVSWPDDTSFHHTEFAQSPHGLAQRTAEHDPAAAASGGV
jgi:uncharacterized protein YjbI with pentapeptide repeats